MNGEHTINPRIQRVTHARVMPLVTTSVEVCGLPMAQQPEGIATVRDAVEGTESHCVSDGGGIVLSPPLTPRRASGRFVSWMAALLFLMAPAALQAQVNRLELIVGQIAPSPLTDAELKANPEKAKIVVQSPVPSLHLQSNLGELIRLPGSSPTRSVYAVDPAVQLIEVRAPGFADTRFRIPVSLPGDVRHYRIQPITPAPDEGRGNLTLLTKPLGATVIVDGIAELRAATPYQFLNQEARTYRIQIDAPYHNTLMRRIRVEEGESLVEYVELEPAFGYVKLNAVDGALQGQAVIDPTLEDEWVEPAALRVDATEPDVILFGVGQPREGYLTMKEGTHELTVSAPGFLATTVEVQVRAGEEIELDAPMEQRFGWVQLMTTDSKGNPIEGVTSNIPESARPVDAPVGRPGIAMNSGYHPITLRAPGYRPEEIRVRVIGGRRIKLPVMLLSEQEAALQPGTLRIVSDERSIIYIDDRRYGAQQVEIRRVPGSIDIRIEHPYANTQRTHFIDPGSEDTLYISSLPTRTKVRTSGIIPGLGHITSKRGRGWLYLAGTALAGAYSIWQYTEFLDLDKAAVATHAVYQTAVDESQVAELGKRLREQIDNRDTAYDRMLTGRYAAIGIYGLSILDVSFTRPEYGFRSTLRERKRQTRNLVPIREPESGTTSFRSMRLYPADPWTAVAPTHPSAVSLRAQLGLVAQPPSIPMAPPTVGLALKLSIGATGGDR